MPTGWPPPGKSGISGALEYLAQKLTVRNFDGTPASDDVRVVVRLTEDGTAVHELTVEVVPLVEQPAAVVESPSEGERDGDQ